MILKQSVSMRIIEQNSTGGCMIISRIFMMKTIMNRPQKIRKNKFKQMGRQNLQSLRCPGVVQIQLIFVPGAGVLAIWGQQRRWHPQRISKLGVRGTSVAICPTYRQKSQKNPLRSREMAFECQSLGRAGKDKSICPIRQHMWYLTLQRTLHMKNGYLCRTCLSFKAFNVRIKINKYANFEKSP